MIMMGATITPILRSLELEAVSAVKEDIVTVGMVAICRVLVVVVVVETVGVMTICRVLVVVVVVEVLAELDTLVRVLVAAVVIEAVLKSTVGVCSIKN